MSVNHYENFPVASLLLPRKLRQPVAVIYHFARSADDIADEGSDEDEVRLRQLALYHQQLERIKHGLSPEADKHYNSQALFTALAKVITQWSLPLDLFHDLLSAFEQDVTVKRYDTREALLDYCNRSANPVGRLMLHLYGVKDGIAYHQADAICTALQLINFWQDVGIDWQKNRIYFPRSVMDEYQVTETHIATQTVDAAFIRLMQNELALAKAMLESGTPLAKRLPGRIGWELRLVIAGGLRIIEKIVAVEYDVFRRRPTLQSLDWLRLFWLACRF